MDQPTNTNGLQLTSPEFQQDSVIPAQYTCKGQDVNPPLNIMNVPPEAKSLALIMHDPDAPSGDFVHWLLWDIPTNTETIAANKVPVGAVQGVTGFGKNQYGGPCPPSGSGIHRYMFELYALDATLSLGPDTSREKLEQAMQGHILEQYTLTGVVAAE